MSCHPRLLYESNARGSVDTTLEGSRVTTGAVTRSGNSSTTTTTRHGHDTTDHHRKENTSARQRCCTTYAPQYSRTKHNLSFYSLLCCSVLASSRCSHPFLTPRFSRSFAENPQRTRSLPVVLLWSVERINRVREKKAGLW